MHIFTIQHIHPPMASFFLLTALFFFPVSYATANPLTQCSFKSIYQFGDSLADTGNLFRIPGATMSFHADRHPYGQTYFGKPTGRFSDGRLIVDYVAAALKLPFVDAYLDTNGSFAHGANFAVAGGTALDNSFFAGRNISMPSFNTPISAQLRWFHAHLNATCGGAGGRECAEKVRNALFIFGEFGGNDYYNALSKGKSLEETKTYVPYTVDAVINGIKHIVKHGAKRVVVPGTLPFGCLPVYLTNFPSSDPKSYDELGCLKTLNDFSSYHNSYLKKALSKLSRELSTVSGDIMIVYGDYYGALRSVLRRGFNNESLLKACCGTGGRYNFDGSKTCGSDGVSACSNPAQYVHWDGIHLTDKSYLRMTEILIRKVLRNIKCS